MRPILMSTSSSASLNQFAEKETTDRNNYSSAIHQIDQKSDRDCNDNSNDTSRVGIYCTLRSPQQQQQQKFQNKQPKVANDGLNLSNQTVNRESKTKMYHRNHERRHQQQSHYNQHIINVDDGGSDEDNSRLLDNRNRDVPMLSHVGRAEQHDFDPTSVDVAAATSKSGSCNLYKNNKSAATAAIAIDNNRDTNYNNGNKEIYCTTAFLRLKENDKNIAKQSNYPIKNSSSASSSSSSASSSDEHGAISSSLSASKSSYPLSEYTKNSLDLLSYCTMSKKLKQIITPSSNSIFNHHHHNSNHLNSHSNSNCDLSSTSSLNLAYHKLNESNVDLMADEWQQDSNAASSNFGLSNNLSTESLKNACDCYDLTDDENDAGNDEDTNSKSFFANQSKLIADYDKLPGSNSQNGKPIQSIKLEQREQPNEQLSSTKWPSKIANNCLLLEKLENHLNELKKFDKNSGKKQQQRNITMKSKHKSQSLDRKRNPSDRRTHNSTNGLTNNDETTTKTTTATVHPSYCTMKRDRHTQNSAALSNRNLQPAVELEQLHSTPALPMRTSSLVKNDDFDDNRIRSVDRGDYNYFSGSSVTAQSHPMASLTAEAFDILNELDQILANTESAISTTSSSTEDLNPLDFDFVPNSNESQQDNDGKASPIQSEATTEKIEDCLFELDEYLDEIDRQTPKLYRDSSEEDYIMNSNHRHMHDDEIVIQWSDEDDDLHSDRETFKRSKTLPKKLLRRQLLVADTLNEDASPDSVLFGFDLGLAKQKKFMTIDRKVELLQRGHTLRNTIAGLRHKIAKVKLKQNDPIESKPLHSTSTTTTIESNSRDLRHNDNQSNKLTGSTSKAWRRNSMRKTSLINLPENNKNSLPQPLLPPPSSSNIALASSSFDESAAATGLHLPESQSSPQATGSMHYFSDSFDQNEIFPNTTTEASTNSTPSHHRVINSLPNDVNASLDVRRTQSHNDCRPQPPHPLENLNSLDLVHDILYNSTLQGYTNGGAAEHGAISRTNNADSARERPRQIGRRAEAHPRILSITSETTESGQRIIVSHDRPVSAPAASSDGRRRQAQNLVSPLTGMPATSPATPTSSSQENMVETALQDDLQMPQQTQRQQSQSRYIGSEASSIGSSRNPSPVSIISSTGSSSLNSTHIDNSTNSESIRQQTQSNGSVTSGNRTSPLDPDLTFQVQSNTGINSYWPHSFSRILALLCCTLGLFNISRFSVLTVHYGGNFLIQFLILSIIFGIPMFWLQMCLGSKIRSGPVSMWKISPICRGIGLSLCLAQCVIALYSTISLAWILVYFRDSFIRKDEFYRWQEAFYIYRRQATNFTTANLTETIADYFNGVVLQRWQLGLGRRIETGGVRFQLAFNLAIIWTLVFIILCKGLRSFGKIVLSLTVIPLVLFFVVTCQLLYIIDFSSVQNIFSASDFEDFLINSKTWTAAAQETFLTWVLLSPSVISITSRSNEKDTSKTVLRRDAIIVVLLTLFGLSLAAVFGYACIQILQNNNYFYVPGSYENMDSYLFLFNHNNQVSPALSSIPIKWIPHYSSVLGETYRRQSAASQLRESGYEPLRLCTELFPAVVAVAQDQISSVFTVLGFLAFLFFGLAQLCAIWKPISSALGNSSSSVLLSCVTGLLLGIPFATEMGLSIIHHLDLIIGGAWWLPILWTAQIFGVFLIRGRPYNGDLLVNDLKMAGSMSAFLALSWNVLLPIGLVSLSVIQYKVSGSNQFYYWRGKSYFYPWARKVGGLVQVGFLLIVPLTAIVQIYRYLNKGPPDILDRIQNLYRPTQSPQPNRRPRPTFNRPMSGQSEGVGSAGNANANASLDTQNVQDDAPPKYTPPPSYTTATGARLAKIFRQSIRRSVRRILGEPSRTRPILHTSSSIENSLPPEYSTVLTDPSGANSTDNENVEIGPRILYNSNTNRNLSSLDRQQRRFTDTNIEIINRMQTNTNTNTNHNRPCSAEQASSTATTSLGAASRINILPFSASDVAQVLRTNRHERSASALATRVVDHALRTSSLRCKSSRSVENLVLNAAPLGESSAIALDLHGTDDDDDANTYRNKNENTSVI